MSKIIEILQNVKCNTKINVTKYDMSQKFYPIIYEISQKMICKKKRKNHRKENTTKYVFSQKMNSYKR